MKYITETAITILPLNKFRDGLGDLRALSILREYEGAVDLLELQIAITNLLNNNSTHAICVPPTQTVMS